VPPALQFHRLVKSGTLRIAVADMMMPRKNTSDTGRTHHGSSPSPACRGSCRWPHELNRCLCPVQGPVVGLRWSSRQEERWKTDEAAIKAAIEKAGGIFLISHDIHDVFDLADRVMVIRIGQAVGSAAVADVTEDEVLGMIIPGKSPPGARPGPGAMRA
jgi:hypothetical protein